MNRLSVTALTLGLAATTGIASAQSYGTSGGTYNATSQSDYARVVRVDPVFDSYRTSQPVGQRCYERPAYVNGDPGYDNGNRPDGYYDQYGTYRDNPPGGTQTGRTVATVVGGIAGAVLGSKIGGGSARYATSAIGSMVGGMAGRGIYDQSKREQQPRTGTVRVCSFTIWPTDTSRPSPSRTLVCSL